MAKCKTNHIYHYNLLKSNSLLIILNSNNDNKTGKVWSIEGLNKVDWSRNFGTAAEMPRKN